MYIIVIILGLCLWYVSTIREGAKGNKRRANNATNEGAILNEKMDAILSLEDRIDAIEKTLGLNSKQINEVVMPALTTKIG